MSHYKVTFKNGNCHNCTANSKTEARLLALEHFKTLTYNEKLKEIYGVNCFDENIILVESKEEFDKRMIEENTLSTIGYYEVYKTPSKTWVVRERSTGTEVAYKTERRFAVEFAKELSK